MELINTKYGKIDIDEVMLYAYEVASLIESSDHSELIDEFHSIPTPTRKDS